MVGVAPNVLTIHALAPYRGWDELSRNVVQALEAYWKVNAPFGVRRLRVRYINRIVIPVDSVALDLYFTAVPRLPGGGGGPIRNFITRVEHPYDDGSVMVMTFAPVPCPAGQCAFVLDFDLVLSFNMSTDSSTTLEALELLRTRERVAFEAMVTDEARKLFA
jgi:uncharacterized protein (TIGR04255 family)